MRTLKYKLYQIDAGVALKDDTNTSCQQANNYRTHLKQPRPLNTHTYTHKTHCHVHLLTRSFFNCLLAVNQLTWCLCVCLQSVMSLWTFPVIQVYPSTDIISGTLYFAWETDFPTDICVPWLASNCVWVCASICLHQSRDCPSVWVCGLKSSEYLQPKACFHQPSPFLKSVWRKSVVLEDHV